MKLHRTSGRPDWESIQPESRTIFQKLAGSTHGIVTPANIITLIGFGAVICGLTALIQSEIWLGIILLAFGRLLDVVDGVVAEVTHTKSPLGEFFDAAVDKIGTLLTIVVLVIVAIAPWWMIVMLITPQIVIPLVVFTKKQRGITIHPTRQGKLSMAATWAGIVGLMITKVLHDPLPLVTFVYGIIITSCILGCYALWQYATGRD